MARGDGEDLDFEEFVAARSRNLFRTAFLLTDNKETAEDLVQTALEKAYQRWWRIRRIDQPEAYLRRVIVNLANDYWRSKKGVQVHAFNEAQLEAWLRDSDHHADPADTLAHRDALMRALKTLPFQMRSVLILRYWECMSERQVADLLGCSLGSVKSQGARGLARLRTLVGVDVLDAKPPGRLGAGPIRGSES